MAVARVAVVYYSRTGVTKTVVESLAEPLRSAGAPVDVYGVLPAEEYSRPLHFNPRLAYETLVRRGTDVKFEPEEPRLEEYDVVVVASPVWFNTLAPPVQEFLRRHRRGARSLVVITTSTLDVDCSRVSRVVEELYGSEPALCVNVRSAQVGDPAELRRISCDISRKIVDLAGGGRIPGAESS